MDSLLVRTPAVVVVQSVIVAEPEKTVLAGAVRVSVLRVRGEASDEGVYLLSLRHRRGGHGAVVSTTAVSTAVPTTASTDGPESTVLKTGNGDRRSEHHDERELHFRV